MKFHPGPDPVDVHIPEGTVLRGCTVESAAEGGDSDWYVIELPVGGRLTVPGSAIEEPQPPEFDPLAEAIRQAIEQPYDTETS